MNAQQSKRPYYFNDGTGVVDRVQRIQLFATTDVVSNTRAYFAQTNVFFGAWITGIRAIEPPGADFVQDGGLLMTLVDNNDDVRVSDLNCVDLITYDNPAVLKGCMGKIRQFNLYDINLAASFCLFTQTGGVYNPGDLLAEFDFYYTYKKPY